MSTVLIVSHEPLEERMSGPSIRNWELARALSREHRVTLAAPGRLERTGGDFEVCGYDAETLPGLVDTHDVVQASGYLLDQHPCLDLARFLVVDLYGPFPLENLHHHEAEPLSARHEIAAHDREIQTGLLQRGDLFICASERQRDFWTGWLTAAGRVNPHVHRRDPGLGSLLRVVPFGLPDEPPSADAARLRGVVPGIGEDDFVVLWGGGIWNWFDPLTLIRAAARARTEVPGLRVVFPALASPSPVVAPMRMAADAQRLADELSLTGETVFFGDGWVPYAERGSLLREADVGISLHREDVETRYSFRTRVLDYLWAGLPVITTEGDSMAELVRSSDLGAVVPYEDVDGVADALVALARSRERLAACSERSAAVAQRFRWSLVARPLLDYCASPATAPDRGQPLPRLVWPTVSTGDETVAEAEARALEAPGLLGRARGAYREGGLPHVLRKGAHRVRRVLFRAPS